MDTAGVERVDLHALGGSDNTVVNDLSATDLKDIELDLETAIGGGAGDGAVDTTTVNGTGGKDAITIAANAGAVEVSGLAAAVKIEHADGATDLLNVTGLSGNDTTSGAIGLASLIKVGLDGGAGRTRSPAATAMTHCSAATATTPSTATGAPTWRSWAPATTRSRGIQAMAATSSRVRTTPTRWSSTARTAPSRSTCRRTARGSGSSELRAAITMDTAGVERVDFNALGGADLVTVNDLSATEVTDVLVDLAGTLGGASGDGQDDRVVVNATDGQDAINVQGDAEVVNISGLAAVIAILHPEFAIDQLDQLEINTLAGVDAVDSSGLVAGVIQVLIDGVPD